MKKIFCLSAALLVVDQIIKYLVAAYKPQFNLEILDIVFVKNTGAVWGSFQGFNLGFIFLSLIALGAFALFYDQFSKKSFPWVLIIAGGILSNLIDRVFRGYVVDFIDFRFWPVFNIADSMIVVGVLVLVGIMFFEEQKKEKGK